MLPLFVDVRNLEYLVHHLQPLNIISQNWKLINSKNTKTNKTEIHILVHKFHTLLNNTKQYHNKLNYIFNKKFIVVKTFQLP